ncbi:MAG: protocatechuate 3,4-dioxygenase [Acidimicrobiaceae bacterium]|nr:protocatechuate 3,4-dioxygenase [Acidimicrobiaceae bacterium]MYF42145.1 protocatechuate 3,4-dioxygenase [Acidimicrobiaceae bacterium]MYJ34500.1 protocatechuate 3,4-dioxygenase [Acidimicrobiaceae bacterium]
MAQIIGGIGTSHVPAVGAAIDHNKQNEPYWAPYFEKIAPVRAWVREAKPDVCIIAYNDHASAFSLALIPTFAIGVAATFPPADEGYGPRQVPDVAGHPPLAWHLAESLILDEFDMTIVNEMSVDHGLTVPLSVMFDQPKKWPCKVVPLCVNVIQYPAPTGNRCYQLGKAIRRAVDEFPGDERVLILGTGGMSHQLQGERAGLVNADFDLAFLDRIVTDPAGQSAVPHTDYLREAGSEGIELVMWMIMRGALDEQVREVHRAHHVPTSNTSNGVIVLENA